jgi:hypothetical protein
MVLENLDVGRRRLPGERLETCHVPPHTIEAPLDSREIGVDAHPVAGILPVRGLEVLSLERARWRCPRFPRHFARDSKQLKPSDEPGGPNFWVPRPFGKLLIFLRSGP